MAGVLSSLFLFLILAVTLRPEPLSRDGGGTIGWFCLVCGDRGLGDALSNVLLFLPLGATLAASVGSALRPAVLCALLSAAIEVAQASIPGRFSSAGDFVFNTLGAGMGALLATHARLWIRPPRRMLSALGHASLVVAMAVVAATGLLNRPHFPRSTYFVMWTPELGHLAHYGGHVIRASLGGRETHPGRAEDPASIAAALRRGDTLEVTFRAGRPPRHLAPIWTVYDQKRREIVLLGADGSDLVFRLRRTADVVHLHRMESRLEDALVGLAPGSRVDARVWRGGSGTLCMSVDRRRRCGMGRTADTGWAFLDYSSSFPRTFVALLGPVWLGLLFFPVGFWGREGRASTGPPLSVRSLVLMLAGLLLIPPVVGLEPTSAWGAAGATVGLLVGSLVARVVSRDRVAPSSARQGPRCRPLSGSGSGRKRRTS